jgi:hypothetical protein
MQAKPILTLQARPQLATQCYFLANARKADVLWTRDDIRAVVVVERFIGTLARARSQNWFRGGIFVCPHIPKKTEKKRSCGSAAHHVMRCSGQKSPSGCRGVGELTRHIADRVMESRYRVLPLRFRVLPAGKPYLLRESVLSKERVCRSDSVGSDAFFRVTNQRITRALETSQPKKSKPRYEHLERSAVNSQCPRFKSCDAKEADLLLEPFYDSNTSSTSEMNQLQQQRIGGLS